MRRICQSWDENWNWQRGKGTAKGLEQQTGSSDHKLLISTFFKAWF